MLAELIKRPFLLILRWTSNALLGRGVGRYKVVAWFYHLLVPLLRPQYVNIDGHKIYLDKKDSLSLSVLGFFEPSVAWAIKNEIKAGMTVVDAGAHIGYFTLMMARAVGPGGKVYAFEPHSENFDLLKRNIKTNGYKNVFLVKAAVSDKKGKTPFFVNEDSGAEHSIYSFSDNQKRVLVNSWSLDEYFKDKETKIDFMKIDVQGAEPLVLQGMKKIIKKNPKIKLIVEIWPHGLEKSNSTPEEFLAGLEVLGFQFCLLRDDKGKYIRKIVSRKSMLAYLKNHGYLNVLCFR